MTYEPLHHKYRPQTFGELVGQEAIAATLTHAIQQQRIAPAYLFTGARGTGKTSSARILAKSLNCLRSKTPTEKPCGTCEVCRAIARGAALDVIEIDAASNTGVDNIRELIERAQFAPVQCRYKVYIIDEVHMLSTAAFNALLKTLEEPPDRVVFVLATTDPQRVLPTIISRCQKFDYRRIPLQPMVKHLGYIAHQEDIAITDEAITLVAQIAQGGLRDAESLLDQLSLLTGEITVEQVWDLVGSVPERDLLQLLQAIAQDQPESLLDSTRRLLDRGREPLIVLQNLASFYRDLLIAKTAPNRNDLVALTPPTWEQLTQLAQTFDLFTILLGQQHLRAAEVQLKHTTQPRLWLEVALMGLLPSTQSSQGQRQAETGGKTAAGQQRQEAGESKPEKDNKQRETERRDSTEVTPSHNAELKPQNSAPLPPATPSLPPAEPAIAKEPDSLDGLWQKVIQEMMPYSTQVMVRQQCRLRGFDGQQARIAVSTQPLLKMAQGKLPNIEAAFETVFGRKIHVVLEVVAAPPATSDDATPHQTGQVPPTLPPAPSPVPPATPPTAPSQRPTSEVPPPQPPQTPANSPPPDAQPPVAPTSPPSEKAWEMEDEVTIAAKRLAEFFAGKVVDMSDQPDGAEEPPSETDPSIEKMVVPEPLDLTNPAIAATDEEEDDDDIPF